MAEPKVRFKRDDGKDFPVYIARSLGDCFQERNERTSGDVQLLAVTQSRGIVLQTETDKRNVSNPDKSNYKVVRRGDIAYNSMRMWQGAEGVSAYNGIVSPAYTVVFPENGIDVRYFEKYFKTDRMLKVFERYSQGLTSDTWNLKYPAFSKIPVSVPCLEEQQKIANFLSSVDEVIVASETEVQNMETQKKAVMKKIFSREVRFKKNDGTDFPEWTSIRLGEYFSFKNGINASRDAFRSDGIKCIGVSDVYRCMPLLSKNIKGTVSLSAAETSRYTVEYGDVLFQRSSETFEDIGHASVYVDNDKAVFNGFVICAKPNKLFYNPYYLHYAMQSDDIRSQTIRLGAGAQHYNIGQDSLSSLNISVPSLDEQRLIANFLSEFDEVIAAAKKEFELWKELKKGLLQQMFV